MTDTPGEPRTTPAQRRAAGITARRAAVAHLAAQRLSSRAIAHELRIGETTVRRDLAHLTTHGAPPPDQPNGAPTAQVAHPAAHRAAQPAPNWRTRATARATQVDTALRQLADAVSAVRDARPSHAPVTDPVGRAWLTQLRQAIAELRAVEADFAEYYPEPRPAGE
ncbi:hypothetical protein ACWEFL_15840 [Streptomyces sp. NPDC004838]